MARRLATLPARLSPLKAQTRTIAPSKPSWRAGKETAHQRGYDANWNRLRRAHLEAHPHCVMCLAKLGMSDLSPVEVVIACAEIGEPEPIGTIGDHIIPHQGRDSLRLDPTNIQTLCKPHHDRDKAKWERENGYR